PSSQDVPCILEEQAAVDRAGVKHDPVALALSDWCCLWNDNKERKTIVAILLSYRTQLKEAGDLLFCRLQLFRCHVCQVWYVIQRLVVQLQLRLEDVVTYMNGRAPYMVMLDPYMTSLASYMVFLDTYMNGSPSYMLSLDAYMTSLVSYMVFLDTHVNVPSSYMVSLDADITSIGSYMVDLNTYMKCADFHYNGFPILVLVIISRFFHVILSSFIYGVPTRKHYTIRVTMAEQFR
ncbi:tRNA(Ile)-lysidine synthase, partial [Frankliniella fusca]